MKILSVYELAQISGGSFEDIIPFTAVGAITGGLASCPLMMVIPITSPKHITASLMSLAAFCIIVGTGVGTLIGMAVNDFKSVKSS